MSSGATVQPGKGSKSGGWSEEERMGGCEECRCIGEDDCFCYCDEDGRVRYL